MEWLSQNWIWILVLIGFVFLMRRGGLGGCGMGHAHQGTDRNQPGATNEMEKPASSGGGTPADSRGAHRHRGC